MNKENESENIIINVMKELVIDSSALDKFLEDKDELALEFFAQKPLPVIIPIAMASIFEPMFGFGSTPK